MIPEPLRTINISIFDQTKFEQSEYVVTTILSCVPTPKMNVYQMTQDELREFMAVLDERLESVICIEPASPIIGAGRK